MTYKIDEIEGIGESTAAKLQGAGIGTTDDLLKLCCNPAGRKAIAGKTGIGESTLLKFTNMADLMRINGVGKQFAELLEAAGVDTVKELGTRNAANLAAKMEEINTKKKVARSSPAPSIVEGWVDQAKKMPVKITY